MEKLKVIQINSASHSFSMKDFEKDMFKGWYAQVAFQTKRFYPKLEIECWTPEKLYKKQKLKRFKNIKFRIFPVNFSIRHGMEISLQMIKALNEEIQKAQKENKKLIIHLHEYHSWLSYLILLLIKKLDCVKIVAQHHGGRNPFENLKKYKRLLLFFPVIALMQICENLLFNKIDLFYVLSEGEITYLKNKTKSEIKFQTMGIEDVYFKKIEKEVARKKLNLKLDKKYILYLGRVKTTKGIRELLNALKKIDSELLLIGEGVDLEKYSEYSKEKKIKNAKFLGPIYGEEKLLYLSACDCLVLPSYTEGAPVVLMEAVARDLPVISTGVGGVKKMIKNNREGLIIKPGSIREIVDAINNIFKWKKKSIKKYAEKYKWEKIIKDTYRDYQLLN